MLPVLPFGYRMNIPGETAGSHRPVPGGKDPFKMPDPKRIHFPNTAEIWISFSASLRSRSPPSATVMRTS